MWKRTYGTIVINLVPLDFAGLTSLILSKIANKDYLDCCKTRHKPLGKHSFSIMTDLRRTGCKQFEHTAFCEDGQCSGKGRSKSHDHSQAD